MVPFFDNPLMVTALIAGLASSVIGGTVGTFVVVRRISFIGGSIAHSLLAGVGLSLFLERSYGFPPLSPVIGALVAALISAYFISRAESSFKEREESIIATVWASGMAIGILLLAKTPGYTTELSSVLIGNILWATRTDLLFLILLAIVGLLFVLLTFQKLKLLTFDIDEARIQGINVDRLYSALLALVGITVVALTQVVGIVLVMTMLTLPQMLAGLFCHRLSWMVVWSIILSSFCTTAGLAVAYLLDWPAGASIALTSTLVYSIGLRLKLLWQTGTKIE